VERWLPVEQEARTRDAEVGRQSLINVFDQGCSPYKDSKRIQEMFDSIFAPQPSTPEEEVKQTRESRPKSILKQQTSFSL